MAWTAPSTWVAGAILTAAQLNQQLRDNTLSGSAAACRVVRTTNLTGYTSGSAITWESVSASGGYQTQSTMWVVGDPTKITVPVAGMYLVTMRAYLTCTATLTAAIAAMAKNADPAVTTTALATSAANSTVASFTSFSTVISLAASDYLKFSVVPSGGSAYVINGAATETFSQSSVTVTWLGQIT